MTVHGCPGVDRLHDEEFGADPFPTWRVLRDECPVVHDPVDDVWVVTRHEDVRSVLLGEVAGTSNRLYERTLGRVFGPNLLQVDGEEHLARRRLVAPLLVGERLRSYAPLVEGAARATIAPFATRGHVDLVEEVAHRLPGTVILSLLGLPHEDLPQLFTWYEAMMRGLWDDPVLRARGRDAHDSLAAYLAPIIEARTAAPGDDLVSRLVTAGNLPPAEVPSFVSLLLTAGGETTDKAIGNLWWHLLTTPDLLAAVRSDPTLLDEVFSETMRVTPSLVYMGRLAETEVEIAGTTIPAGSSVRVGLASANHDDRVFDEPEVFRPGRRDLHEGRERRTAPRRDGRSSHLAFGAGPHFCLGYELARLEVVTVSRLLVAVMGDPVLTEDVAPVVEGPTLSVPRLPVRFTPRPGALEAALTWGDASGERADAPGYTSTGRDRPTVR